MSPIGYTLALLAIRDARKHLSSIWSASSTDYRRHWVEVIAFARWP